MDPRAPIAIAPDEELQLSSAQVRAILDARAAKLARGFDPAAGSPAELMHLIAFSRGAHHYGVPLERLAEIRPLPSWTPVPGVPAVFVGVIQLRGEILAVVDLAVLFGAEAAERPNEPIGIIVSVDGVAAALLADAVDDVYDLTPERIHPPLATFSAARQRYISGLSDEGVAVVDVDKLLRDGWLRVSHEPHEERR